MISKAVVKEYITKNSNSQNCDVENAIFIFSSKSPVSAPFLRSQKQVIIQQIVSFLSFNIILHSLASELTLFAVSVSTT